MTTFCLTPTLNVGGNEANDFEVLGFSYTDFKVCHMWCMSHWCMSLSLFSWSNNADRLDTPCTRWLGDRCVVRFLRSTSCHLQSWPKVVALKIFIPPWFIISSYRIKIWQLDEASGSWRAQDEWKVNNTHFLAISFEFNPTLQTVDIYRHMKLRCQK